MCMTCGCMMVEKKTSPDALTLDDLVRIAESHGLDVEEVVYNIGLSTDTYLSALRAKQEEYHKLAK